MVLTIICGSLEQLLRELSELTNCLLSASLHLRSRAFHNYMLFRGLQIKIMDFIIES